MCQLIESIKLQNNILQNLEYHEKRMIRSSMEIWGKEHHHCADLKEIQKAASKLDSNTIYKLRIVYNDKYFDYGFEIYELKEIKSLKLIENPDIEYANKYLVRQQLDSCFNLKDTCDDILITRYGAISDSYYCNVAFEKDGCWYTPDMPLLKGTKRQLLLDKKLIQEADVFIEDIPDYSKIRLFNALIEFGEIELSINEIQID